MAAKKKAPTTKAYCTTIGNFGRHTHTTETPNLCYANDPKDPGEGWRLVSSAADNGIILWFWEKDVEFKSGSDSSP